MEPVVWLVGYGAWPAPRRAEGLLDALKVRGVTRLVDVRLSPCSSMAEPGRPYGPRPWNLQAGEAGLAGLVEGAGIAYEWMVELGNPQRRDPTMAVLRHHLANPGGGWPIHRGLERLARRVEPAGEFVTLLCACADGRTCHRTVVARELSRRHFDGRLALRDVRSGDFLPG